MDSAPILAGLEAVTKKWTRQRKAEERHARALSNRRSMWTYRRHTLKEIVVEVLPTAWAEASDNGRLPTHWRMVFYRARPLVAERPDVDRPLTDAYFKTILEEYIETYRPGWDVLRGARGVLKEPHTHETVAMSTMAVRNYLRGRPDDLEVPAVKSTFPTHGAPNRFAAVLICEKEGFDELLEAEHVPERYDLALMSTKGISAHAARDLARGLGVPCLVLHDFDKNGFVMAAGFPFATDIGLRLADIEACGLASEEQTHSNVWATQQNLRQNGATSAEADYIAHGQRIELNELTGLRFIEFVEAKLAANGVKKIIPNADTLATAWRRARLVHQINDLIEAMGAENAAEPIPEDLAEQVAAGLALDPEQSWDDVISDLADDEAES